MKPQRLILLSFATPLLVGLAVASTWTIWSEIASRAMHNPEDSHIVLALPVAVWLGMLRRSRLRKWRPTPSVFGPLLVMIGWFLVWLGYELAVDVAQHLGALLVVLGAITSILGGRILLLLKPSLIALLFLFPVPGRFRQHVAIPLQHISAFVSEHILQLFGVDVVRSG
ncbi:MAG: exosortase/archaeosortase family protein, partial [Phycisphaerales bacterium]|nr:exosortase/archaeosortase family protein [Phycisphaerales bacterium]